MAYTRNNKFLEMNVVLATMNDVAPPVPFETAFLSDLTIDKTMLDEAEQVFLVKGKRIKSLKSLHPIISIVGRNYGIDFSLAQIVGSWGYKKTATCVSHLLKLSKSAIQLNYRFSKSEMKRLTNVLQALGIKLPELSSVSAESLKYNKLKDLKKLTGIAIPKTKLLADYGIVTFDSLFACTHSEILSIPGYGRKTFIKLESALKTIDCSLSSREKRIKNFRVFNFLEKYIGAACYVSYKIPGKSTECSCCGLINSIENHREAIYLRVTLDDWNTHLIDTMNITHIIEQL